MLRALLPIFFVFLFSGIVSPVRAEFDIEYVDDAIGLAIGGSSTAGGILISVVLMMFGMLPIGYLSKQFNATFIVGFAIMCFCSAVTWLPSWLVYVSAVFCALLSARFVSGLVR